MPPCMGRSKSSLLYLINGSPDSCGLECCWEPAHSWPLSVHKVNPAHRGKPSHSERTRFSTSHIWKTDDQDMITRQSRELKTYHDWQMRHCCHCYWLLLMSSWRVGYCLMKLIFSEVGECFHYSPSCWSLRPTRTCHKGHTIPYPNPCPAQVAWLLNGPSCRTTTALLWIQVHSRVFLQVSKEGAKQSCKD